MNNNTKQLITNTWLQFNYNLDNKLLTEIHIKNALNLFNNQVLSKLSKDQYVTIIFRTKTDSNYYRNISNLQNVKKDDFHSLLEIFIEFWSIKDEEYLTYIISEIIFSYKINDMNQVSNHKLLNIKPLRPVGQLDISNKTNLLRFGGFKLPITMDLFEWGKVIFYNNNEKAIVYKNKSNSEYHITFKDSNTMEVLYQLNNKTLLKFRDKLIDSNNLKTFIRHVNNKEYQFENGDLICKSKIYNLPKIKTLKRQPYLIHRFLTLDIETKVVDNVITPYAISYFDGKIVKSFYETDFISPKEMIKTALTSLLIRKYHNYKVYIHNLSNFDGIFLFNILTEIGQDIKPIINEGKFLDITIKFDDKYKLHFRDSLLMLPVSLRKLANNFKVENKGLFPYRFVNSENIMNNYNGDVPKFEYFDNINYQEYVEYCNSFKNHKWNLKNETLKYCEQDVKTLYSLLDIFFKNNFSQTRVNPSKCVSLPRLALTNFRTKFLDQNIKIPTITGEIYLFIKESYTGGAVDVFKPYGTNIYRYDVNSLYPFIMKNYPMPVGNPTFFEGNSNLLQDIVKDKNKFSFVEVELTCPLDLNIPLLTTRYKLPNGSIRTIAPVGSWKGVYTSIEINRALELGYTFKFLKGVSFDSKIIFNDYVDFYFNKKKNSDKNSSHYTISKLMLNSLDGRFGMNPYLDKYVVVDEGLSLELVNNFTVNEIYPLNNGKKLISYQDKVDLDQIYVCPNVNIAIASAVTAGARVFMSQFKNMKDLNVYYSDTDSMDVDRPLDSKYVGSELGLFKLEHVFDQAVYLGPKMYGGITKDYEYIKIKGLKNPIPFNELKLLLDRDKSLTVPNPQWYKNLSIGNIKIKDELYTLSITDQKRRVIYDANNKFVDTKPLILNL